jgi:hypothetical protein
MLALNPDGTGYEWSPDHSKMSYDPLQGPAYHLSKTKDFVSGQVRKRLSNPLCEPFYQDRLGTNTAENSEKTRFLAAHQAPGEDFRHSPSELEPALRRVA